MVRKKQWHGKRSHHLDSTSILPSGCDVWELTSPPGIRTISASFKSKGNELKRTSTGPVTLASPPGIKPWSLRSVGNVLDYGSSAALSLGGLFGSKEVFVGKRGDQETATGKSHQLGYLFRLQHMETLSFVSGALSFVSGASTCAVAWRLDMYRRCSLGASSCDVADVGR